MLGRLSGCAARRCRPQPAPSAAWPAAATASSVTGWPAVGWGSGWGGWRGGRRSKYTHTERAMSKGRRAAERAAYKTLDLERDASEREIKAAFRAQALKHHPDLSRDDESGAGKMAELVAAYDMLMGSDLSRRAAQLGWGKLSLHCEIYSVPQLRAAYDVHAVVLHFEPEFRFDDDDECSEPEREPEPEPEPEPEGGSSSALAEPPPREWPIDSHPFDSGADLKRHLQDAHGEEWGLSAPGTHQPSTARTGHETQLVRADARGIRARC